MVRTEETHVTYKCPADFVPSGPRSISFTPRLIVPFVARDNGSVTGDLIEQIREFITPAEDGECLLERVHVGLSEAIAHCAQTHLAGSHVRVLFIRHDFLLQNGLTFIVDCIPDPGKPVDIPNPQEVPTDFCPTRFRHLGYRRMVDASDGFDIDFIPRVSLMMTLSFLDPRP